MAGMRGDGRDEGCTPQQSQAMHAAGLCFSRPAQRAAVMPSPAQRGDEAEPAASVPAAMAVAGNKPPAAVPEAEGSLRSPRSAR